MQPKLIISFEHLSEPGFLLLVTNVDTSLSTNNNFPLPWGNGVPTPAMISTAVAAYKLAYKAAEGGDRGLIKIRNTQRKALTAQLKKVAPYLEIVADGDAGVLATTGFTQRHDIVKGVAPVILAALTGLKVTRAALSGGLTVHAKADPHADVYHVQIASADPSVEANWSATVEYVHCNRIDLTGLTPTKTYYVRIRGFNKSGAGVWATSAGIVVL